MIYPGTLPENQVKMSLFGKLLIWAARTVWLIFCQGMARVVVKACWGLEV